MSKLTEKYPFDFSPNGGTIHELGESYVKETERIYDLLNDIRENNEGTTEPQPKQLMISESGKIYIRSLNNMGWVYIGELKENLGLNELGFIKREDIGLDIENPTILDIDIKGNAGKIGGYPVLTTNFQDGEVYNIEGEENIREFLWNKVKEVNNLMPKYKYIKETTRIVFIT